MHQGGCGFQPFVQPSCLKMHNKDDVYFIMIVAFTFIGPLPSYAVDTVHQVRLFYDGPIYFTINDYDNPIIKTLQDKYAVTIVRYDTVVDEFFIHTVDQFKHKFCIVESLKGREKLFIYAFERFFLLYNLMVQQNLTNVFFMELDNLIYDDPRCWETALATKDMSFMFDHHDRGASGVCFLRSPHTLRKFCDESLQFIQQSSEFINEMTVLYRFWQKNRDDIFLMPIHWTDSAVPAEACANFDKFNHTIFDAASIGIYLGGMDPHHTGGVIQYKLKGKWSAVDYTNYTFTWKEDSQGRRIPYIWGAGKFLRINNLHIHSKLLAPLLSKPIQNSTATPSIDHHTIPGAIPVVMGGLGNQMFIVAAAFVAGKKNGYPVYLLENALENNKHNTLKQNYNDTIFKHMGVRIPIVGKSHEFAQFVRHYGYTEHRQHGFQPWRPEEVSSGSVMNSYYQFYPALEPYETELREVILQGLQQYRNAFNGRDLSKSAFLHIRRGDYLENPHIHFIQQTEYYKTCVMQLLDTVGFQGLQTIYVVSDDMEWVRSQPFFQNSLFTMYDSKDELMTLGLMSLCKAGAICGNSTFSWWGAFLGAHSARAPVFVPKRWIGGDNLPVALFPEEWITV
jgi:hypothetical protein